MHRTPEERRIAVMDTTLRDGEQTPDISYTPPEKREIARFLLAEVDVDRIEIASTRVSEGERLAAARIASWARREKLLPRIEILGYSDGKASVDWIRGVKATSMNLLTKGSERHCREQLRMTPEQHRKQIENTLRYARSKRLRVAGAYLEDWSNGVRDAFDYVHAMVRLLHDHGVERVYLADTLGVLAPPETHRLVTLMTTAFPDVVFEFHAHNDYGLANANCLAAVAAGARGVHTSVNGLGERAGNAKLAEVVTALHDQTEFRTGVDETRLVAVSRLVETFSGKEVPANSPIVGRDVFTQTAGIHADGDAKGDLYASRLAPARFARQRRYALGKLSGRASLDQNLKALGIDLPEPDRALVLKRIIELGDKKHTVVPEDLPYIIADVLKRPDDAEVALAVGDRVEKAQASGDGGYDAFMNALKKAARRLDLKVPRLEDFRVRIPPGGRTGALVETLMTWRTHGGADGTLTTVGVDSDQLAAAVIATEKMLNSVVRERTG
jgi:D-citramalate synthase